MVLDHESCVMCLDVRSADQLVVTGTDGGMVHVWEMTTGSLREQYHGESEGVCCDEVRISQNLGL